MSTWEGAETLEAGGDWVDARRAYHDLFWRALRGGRGEEAVNALRGGARVLFRSGSYEEAEELAELTREIATRSGLPQAAARATNLCAAIRYAQQDWATAEQEYQHAMEMALDVGDDELIGLTCQNLGILANIRGDLGEARIRYLESVGSFVRCGSESSAATAYNNLGMVCADMCEWIEARLYFDRGLEIAERAGGSAQLLASLHTNRVEALLRLGELGEAAAELDRAEPIAQRIGARSTLVDIARHRGVLARLRRDPAGAAEHLQASLELATEGRIGIGRAEATEELAVLREEQGRRDEAIELFETALALFLELRAERDAERVRSALERLRQPTAA